MVGLGAVFVGAGFVEVGYFDGLLAVQVFVVARAFVTAQVDGRAGEAEGFEKAVFVGAED